MGTFRVPASVHAGVLVFCLIVFIVFTAAHQAQADAAAEMQAYCSVPPLTGVKPNLLLLLDNSASMYDLAYTNPQTFCLDDSFNPAAEYPGYFEAATVYQYSTVTDRFVAAPGASIESSTCNQARAAYLCVNLNNNSKKLDNFLATGKFLNWLAMSKQDLEKLALTGGKYIIPPSGNPDTGFLQAESRGCQGKRYVKIVNDASGTPLPVTFGVRGPIPSESGYVQQANHGGPSRIDVYPARYNTSECLLAVRKWQEGAPASEVANAAASCMGKLEDPVGVPTAGKVFAEIMSYCYKYLAGTEILYTDLSKDLLLDCRKRTLFFYSGDASKIPKNVGDDVCGKELFHNLLFHDGAPTIQGYLGQCYAQGFPEGCSVNQTKDFCAEVEKPWLIDPSANAAQAATNSSLPSFILDAGITNLGKVAATLQVRVASAAAPTGLIQQFADDINFGAMVFNDNGAGSECGAVIPCVKHCSSDPVPRRECYVDGDCGSGTCSEDTRNDGGRIISYLNYGEIGNHDKGLIAAVDAIRGTSWTPLAEAFYEAIGYFGEKPSFRFQSADFDPAYPPSRYTCQRNNVLVLTDGMSTADRAPAVNSYVAAAAAAWVNPVDGMPAGLITTASTPVGSPPVNLGSYNLDDLAWIARHKNIFDPAQPVARHKDYITTHVIYTGPPCGDPGSRAGYDSEGSCTTSDEGKPEKLMQLAAAKGGGSINSVYNPAGLQGALAKVFLQIAGGFNTGTSSSLLATGEGNGALFLQPQFYPHKSFDGGKTSGIWMGELQALWYYIDNFMGGGSGSASRIREDTQQRKTLDLELDRVVEFVVEDPVLQESRARLLVDADGDGNADSVQPAGYPLTVLPEAVHSLWRAGRQLWERSPVTRTIYTQTGGTSLVPLLDTSTAVNRQLLLARDQAEANQIVAFVKGSDDTHGGSGGATRDRSLTAYGGSEKKVWKLGDIISSTPALQSAAPLGSYHLSAPVGYGDPSYRKFVDVRGAYAGRGTVYAGANDGMLHAFRLGQSRVHPVDQEVWPGTRKAVLDGTDLGKEEWGFVPKNALPYLRYLKEPLYLHLYYVDGAVTLLDASIGDPALCSRDGYWNCTRDNSTGSNWRTVLIGGMGLGGASRLPDGPACDEGASATCVKAPAAGVGGLSSYFALDVTTQAADGTGTPRFLWEFSHPNLGFATSGAAIIRVNARTINAQNQQISDRDKNGRWFAVFASGPTGAVDRKTRQFTAVSDQNLKLFVVDLNAVPPLTQGGNYWVIDTGIPNAFGGSMAGAGIDADKWSPSSAGNYEDDALYVGYTRAAAGGGWTGGVLRLFTGEDPDPAKWKASIVIDDTGPVTGAIGKLQDRQYKRLWLYFGAGRYFNRQDDLSAARSLYGVREPCYDAERNTFRKDDEEVASCSGQPVLRSDLVDVTDVVRVVQPRDQGSNYRGWRIDLDAASGTLGSERSVDSPSTLTGGVVFFTTYRPSLEPCQEGLSYLWGVHYSTGGPARSVSAQALMPLSNGGIPTLDAGGLSDRDNRRSPPRTGKGVKPRLVTNSGLKPLRKIIHIQER
ncbi:pilus assembly protein PilY [Geomonas oryzisoli]|uniref:Pilus assembly protein PilY n=1 Tax=Geomonas oryzisoli TaxID=2847992 RepID=A0ABX8J544_9BACT|nr:pilus assembly protein PilY [Geomonas oryzisoli]QWV92176.1 pilus assembly protein PilY [Geomonas oryzisoli]